MTIAKLKPLLKLFRSLPAMGLLLWAIWAGDDVRLILTVIVLVLGLIDAWMVMVQSWVKEATGAMNSTQGLAMKTAAALLLGSDRDPGDPS